MCHWADPLDLARSQVGQPHAFRIPTWAQRSDRRMGDRKYRFASITTATHILFEEVAASCCEGLSHFAKLEAKESRWSDECPTTHFDLGPSTALGSHLCVALPSVWANPNLTHKNETTNY